MSTASQALADSTPEQQGAAQPFDLDEGVVGTITGEKAVNNTPPAVEVPGNDKTNAKEPLTVEFILHWTLQVLGVAAAILFGI
jgi:hypothetical protein